MNRIQKKFQSLRKQNKKALIVFITAGDPTLRKTEDFIYAFEKSGVDLIELGVPFSDPVADGPVIQASSQRALQRKASLKKILKLVGRVSEAHQAYLGYRKKFLEIPKRDRRYAPDAVIDSE